MTALLVKYLTNVLYTVTVYLPIIRYELEFHFNNCWQRTCEKCSLRVSVLLNLNNPLVFDPSLSFKIVIYSKQITVITFEDIKFGEDTYNSRRIWFYLVFFESILLEIQMQEFVLELQICLGLFFCSTKNVSVVYSHSVEACRVGSKIHKAFEISSFLLYSVGTMGPECNGSFSWKFFQNSSESFSGLLKDSDM